jgi:hypothetical protein
VSGEQPGPSVEVLACGDCAALDRIDPLTLLANATVPCPCGCGWDQFVCQICGKPVGIRTTLGRLDLEAVSDAGAGDVFQEDI